MNTLALAFGNCVTVPAGHAFQQKTGVGRSQQYELIAAGEIESVLVGRRRLIIMASYLAYLERQRRREAAGEIGMASPNPRARQSQAAQPAHVIDTSAEAAKTASPAPRKNTADLQSRSRSTCGRV